MNTFLDCYISVDIETAGPNPGQYDLLSFGACTVEEPHQTLYVEFQPTRLATTAEAAAVHGLDLERLEREGLPPAKALGAVERWLSGVVPEGACPVLTAFNAPFDWMFVNDYFHRYLGRNPFGHTALDIKALYMGVSGVTWGETSMRYVARRYLGGKDLTHHALDDAMDQARIFQALMTEIHQEVCP